MWDPVQLSCGLVLFWDGVQGVISIAESQLLKCLACI